jgi:hypothetical protein
MKKILLSLILTLLYSTFLSSQGAEEYISLYQNNEYQKSYDMIILKLNEIYSKRV